MAPIRSPPAEPPVAIGDAELDADLTADLAEREADGDDDLERLVGYEVAEVEDPAGRRPVEREGREAGDAEPLGPGDPQLGGARGHLEQLADLGGALGADAVLDGEIVALGPDGVPSFERLPPRMQARGANAVRAAMAEVTA